MAVEPDICPVVYPVEPQANGLTRFFGCQRKSGSIPPWDIKFIMEYPGRITIKINIFMVRNLIYASCRIDIFALPIHEQRG